MIYIAKCYIGHAGTVLRPGDAFEADSRDEKIERLLRLDAVTPATPAFAPAAIENADGTLESDAQENHRQQMESLGYDASGEPLEGEGSADEAEEAPEIDGLDGIVSGDAEPAEPAEEAPTKKNRRKRT